jgi:hypothetical protein
MAVVYTRRTKINKSEGGGRWEVRQKVHVRLAHTTVTLVNENGDENGATAPRRRKP